MDYWIVVIQGKQQIKTTMDLYKLEQDQVRMDIIRTATMTEVNDHLGKTNRKHTKKNGTKSGKRATVHR
jgi:hypothetical protein